MEGQVDFETALRERVKLLSGLDANEAWTKIKDNITFNVGARDLIPRLKSSGLTFHTAVLSGGFIPIAEHVRDALGFNYCAANSLSVDVNGKLTGELEGLIMSPKQKRDTTLELAERYGVPKSNIVAVGDGANDLLMISAAGVGIAYMAKPIVRKQARYRLDQPDLSLINDFIDNFSRL